jgi:hypothetical protein
MRVERSIARDPLHPSATTANAALARDPDDIALRTPKEAPALFQTHFDKIDEEPPKRNDPHHRRPENELTHLGLLLASANHAR